MTEMERKELLELFRQFLRIKSISSETNEREAAAWLMRQFEAEGIDCRILEKEAGRSNFIARLPGLNHDNPMSFISHIDVVPPGEGWSCDPFGAEIISDCVFARGALDTKDLTIMEMFALFLLKRHKIIPQRDILFIGSADEECGSRLGMKYLSEEHPELFQGDDYISEGGGFVIEAGGRKYRTCCCGEKGVCDISVICNETDEVKARAKFFDVLEKAASFESREIITEPLEAFRRIAGDSIDECRTLRDLWEYSTKDNLVVCEFDTSKIDFSHGFELKLQYKHISDYSTDDIGFMLKSLLCDDTLTFELQVKSIPYICNLKTSVFETIERVTRRLDPTAQLLPMLALGNTDGRFIRKNTFGYSPILGTIPFSAVLKKVHQADECLDIESLYFGTEIMLEMMQTGLENRDGR